MRRFESGGSKRKRAQEEREKVVKLPKLTQFLVPQAAVSDTATAATSISQCDTSCSCDGAPASSACTNQTEILSSPELATLTTEPKGFGCDTNTDASTQPTAGGYDIGKLFKYNDNIPDDERAFAVKEGIPLHPKFFPADQYGNKFPMGALSLPLKNGERTLRDYLAWSECLQSLFCFPCRLFSSSEHQPKSILCLPCGWSATNGPSGKNCMND